MKHLDAQALSALATREPEAVAYFREHLASPCDTCEEFLAQHPGRVFSREQLLDSVWGSDIYVEVRTVDGSPPYLVRWDDGHVGLYFPGPDAHVDHLHMATRS